MVVQNKKSLITIAIWTMTLLAVTATVVVHGFLVGQTTFLEVMLPLPFLLGLGISIDRAKRRTPQKP